MNKRIRAVGIVLVGDSLLVMYRRNEGREYFVLPGGGVEEGETTEEAVVRELREETSIEVTPKRLLYHHRYDDATEQFFFLCACQFQTPRLHPASNEASDCGVQDFYEPRWVKVTNLSSMLLYPLEIRDWLIEDLKKGFDATMRSASLSIANLRQVL
jgi:8-oxo-dGTP diphosphatase